MLHVSFNLDKSRTFFPVYLFMNPIIINSICQYLLNITSQICNKNNENIPIYLYNEYYKLHAL